MMNERDIEELRQQNADLLARIVRLEDRTANVNNPVKDLFLAKDGADPGEWVEQQVHEGAISEHPDPRDCTDDTQPFALIDPADSDAFFVVAVDDTDGGSLTKRYVKVGGGGGNLRYVTLSSPSGAAGDEATQATWTYTATDADTSEAYGAGIAYAGRTWPIGADSATFGILHVSSGGTKTLVYANELPILGAC